MHAVLQIARLAATTAIGVLLAVGASGCAALGPTFNHAFDVLSAQAKTSAEVYAIECLSEFEPAVLQSASLGTGQEAAESIFRQAAEACETEVEISRTLHITKEDLEAAVHNLRMTPEYLCSTGEFAYTLSAPSEEAELYVSGLTLGYDYDVSLIPQYRAELKEVANRIVNELVTPDMSDVERALVLHDWLVENCEYDQALQRYSAYDALVLHSATCQGYVQAYKMLLDLAGVPCVYVESETMEHSWNLVKIGGTWYHVDTTWDDPIIIGDNGGSYPTSREHFLKSDSQMESLGYSDWTAPYAVPDEYPGSF